MKKRSMAAIAAVLFASMSSLSAIEGPTFEDKPALSTAERAVLIAAKSAGVAFGAGSGYKFGKLAATPRDQLEVQVRVGAPLALLGYEGGKSLAIHALAKFHSVSYRVEVISQYYNINISQYHPILMAAAQKKPQILVQEMDDIYTMRFGENWKERMKELFKKYRKRAPILIKKGSFIRKGNLKDFLRMVELGAAMANLYFGTNPDKKYTVNFAIKLYQELGLL